MAMYFIKTRRYVTPTVQTKTRWPKTPTHRAPSAIFQGLITFPEWEVILIIRLEETPE